MIKRTIPLPSNVRKYTLTSSYIHDTMTSTDRTMGTIGVFIKKAKIAKEKFPIQKIQMKFKV